MEYFQPILTTMSNNDLLQSMYGCLENSDDGFLIVDTDGKIAYINQAYCDYLNQPRNKLIGKPVIDYIDTSTLAEASVNPNYPPEKQVLHRVSDKQYRDGEHYCIVNRTNVSLNGRSISGVGQIKFIRSTLQLSSAIKEINDELAYYKEELQRLSAEQYSLTKIIGSSPEMRAVKEMVNKSATNDFPVLITGETGTGKEVFANAIHYVSDRRNRPFIRINCAAIPANLFESELFGYEKGAFTGANKTGKKGKFELADTGTLFLDEIGDMPLEMQVKLLRVLQEKEVERVGSEKPIPVDVRIIAATNKNLPLEIEQKRFRSDLYYRLNVINIVIPPLRKHPSDIDTFIDTFIDELNIKYHSDTIITDHARELLRAYSWPGNVRELKNIIERCFVLQDAGVIHSATIPLPNNTSVLSNQKQIPTSIPQHLTLAESMEEIEKELILSAIHAHNGNLRATAKDLNIHRVTLYKKLEKYHLRREDFED